MWKKKEDGNLVMDSNGNPVWVDEYNNAEKSVDYLETRRQISELTEKAHNRKEAYDKILSILADNNLTVDVLPEFIQESKVNKEKLEGLGKGGDNDSLKPLQDQINALKELIQKEKQEKQVLIDKQNLDNINSKFLESPFLKEKSDPILCRDIFKNCFKIEDGKIVGYLDGKVIRNDEMEVADFEYCIKKLIENYPARDKLLVGSVSGGAGNKGSGSSFENYGEMSFAELCARIDSTTDPVLKANLTKQLKRR